MKSPAALARQLARQWQQADWRERYLLNAQGAWPLRLTIGLPSAHHFQHDSAQLRQHVQQWRAVVAEELGEVQWESRSYRGGSQPVELPTHWLLPRPSAALAAIVQYCGAEGAQLRIEHQALAAVLAAVDARFHRLLLRRLALWRGTPVQVVIQAAHIALQLRPGCAHGLPLRALTVAGNDSKFFERHGALITALLDVLFDGAASRQGLVAFLGASAEDEHWLLVAPLAPGLLPFVRQRVPTTELARQPLPGTHVLLVENERCLHLLPQALAGCVAILGAGLDLAWLASAPWLQQRRVAYWGDIDTWGLHMLASARGHVPQLQALLMDRATFDAHPGCTVAEPQPAPEPEPGTGTLLPEEMTLDAHLRSLVHGRLEQEFLRSALVMQTVRTWGCPA